MPDPDRLDQMFKAQTELNAVNHRDPKILPDENGGHASTLAGLWLCEFIDCMSNEGEELRNCTFWKHWCAEAKAGDRFKIHDLDNAKVEVVDMLHFLLSMALCLGMTAEDLSRIYFRKMAVNLKRQVDGYSMKGKTEDDNKGLAEGDRVRTADELRPGENYMSALEDVQDFLGNLVNTPEYALDSRVARLKGSVDRVVAQEQRWKKESQEGQTRRDDGK